MVSVDFPPPHCWIPSNTSVHILPRIFFNDGGVVPVARLELVCLRKHTYRSLPLDETAVRVERQECSPPIELHHLFDVRTTDSCVHELFSSLPHNTRRSISTGAVWGLANFVTGQAVMAAHRGIWMFNVVMEVWTDDIFVPAPLPGNFNYTDDGNYEQIHDNYEDEGEEEATTSEGFDENRALTFPDTADSRSELCHSEWEDQGRCVVCMEDFEFDSEDMRRLPCRHVFHSNCITEWLHYSSTCPICRLKVQKLS